MAKILLADDDPELRELLSAFLGLRFDVIAVGNGADALEAARTQRPDLIVLDMVMPKIDGLTLCERLKADAQTAHIPICIMTAATRNSDTHDSVWRMAAGSDDFITKPFEPQQLMAKVEALLRAAVEERRRVRRTPRGDA